MLGPRDTATDPVVNAEPKRNWVLERRKEREQAAKEEGPAMEEIILEPAADEQQTDDLEQTKVHDIVTSKAKRKYKTQELNDN